MTELDYQNCIQFDNHSYIRMYQYTLVVPFYNRKAQSRFGWESCSILNTLLSSGFLQKLKKPIYKD